MKRAPLTVEVTTVQRRLARVSAVADSSDYLTVVAATASPATWTRPLVVRGGSAPA